MSEVATFVMTEAEALRLTEKIRVTAHTYAEARGKLIGYVEEAKTGNAHVALGYRSWTEYLSEVLGEEPMRLARDERREVVQLLSGEGMSTRTIAPIVGAGIATVHRDRVSGVPSGTPERDATSDLSPAPEQPTTPEAFEEKYGMRPDEADALISSGLVATREEFDAAAVDLADVDKETGEIHDRPVQKITGRDGKTYTRPEPRPSTERTEPKKGTDLHALRYVIVPTLDAWAATWTEKPLLDDSVTAEEAAQILRDLSRTTPVLSQIRRLLNSRTGA